MSRRLPTLRWWLLGGLAALNLLALAWIAFHLEQNKSNHELRTQVASRNMAQALDQALSSRPTSR